MVVPALPSHRRVVPRLFLTILVVVACRPGEGGPSPTSAATMAVTPPGKLARTLVQAQTAEPVRAATSAGTAAQARTATLAGAAAAAAASYFVDALMATGRVAR